MNLKDLREIAERVKQERPWKCESDHPEMPSDAVTVGAGRWFSPGHYPKCTMDEDPTCYEREAAHIAAFSPQTVLSLLSDLEKCVECLNMVSAHPDAEPLASMWAKECLSSLTIRSDEG